MIIIGIDPGATSIGYAALEVIGRTARLKEAQLITTGDRTPLRLLILEKKLTDLIKHSGAEIAAVEKLFFTKNQKTAISVAEARGVILLTTFRAGLKVYEYAPREVKKAVTDDGTADKLRIKKMLGILLPETRELAARDDVFDAIAIALTCVIKEGAELSTRARKP